MDTRPRYRIYEGEGLLDVKEDTSIPLVQDMLYEGDFILLVGKEKSCKSIFSLQMACALSTGKKFFNIFEVPKSVMVWYFVLEGKDYDIQLRLQRMSQILPIETKNIKLLCGSGLQFNSTLGKGAMVETIEKYEKTNELPKVIIVDPLYQALSGSLSDDNKTREFIDQVRQYAYWCKAAVILIHHTTKEITLNDGRKLKQTDDSTFGSTYWKAAVDHLFFMRKTSSEFKKPITIELTCSTQRSGDIISHLDFKLHEPEPLYLELLRGEENDNYVHAIQSMLSAKPMTAQEIADTLNIARPTVYYYLPSISNIIHVRKTRPYLFGIQGVDYGKNVNKSNNNSK